MKRAPDTSAPPIVQALDTAFRCLRWLALLLVALYLATGSSCIQPEEKAIVLTLGRVSRVEPPGLLIAWPYPIDEVVRVATREAKRLEVDTLWHALPPPRQVGAGAEPLSPEEVYAEEFILEKIDPAREGYCITGDREILQAYVAVKYRVSDPVAYALGHADPEALLQNVVLCATTHVLGEIRGKDYRELHGVLSGRIERRVQERLDEVDSGIQVDAVELVYFHPPRHVIKAFRDVDFAKMKAAREEQTALAEKERRTRQAEVLANKIVTDAENRAQKMREEALGTAKAFLDLLAEYRQNPEVVAERLYREAVEEIFEQARLRVIEVVPGGRTDIWVELAEEEEEKPQERPPEKSPE